MLRLAAELEGHLQGGGAAQRRQLGPAGSGGQGAPGKRWPRRSWKVVAKELLGRGRCVSLFAGRVRALCQGPRLPPCSALRLAAGFGLPLPSCLGPCCAWPSLVPLHGVLSCGSSAACSPLCAAMATRDAKLRLKTQNKQILHAKKPKASFLPCSPQPVFFLSGPDQEPVLRSDILRTRGVNNCGVPRSPMCPSSQAISQADTVVSIFIKIANFSLHVLQSIPAKTRTATLLGITASPCERDPKRRL